MRELCTTVSNVGNPNPNSLTVRIAIHVNPPQSHGPTPVICATCHLTQVNVLHLNPSQAGRYWIYLPQRERKLSWDVAHHHNRPSEVQQAEPVC